MLTSAATIPTTRARAATYAMPSWPWSTTALIDMPGCATAASTKAVATASSTRATPGSRRQSEIARKAKTRAERASGIERAAVIRVVSAHVHPLYNLPPRQAPRMRGSRDAGAAQPRRLSPAGGAPSRGLLQRRVLQLHEAAARARGQAAARPDASLPEARLDPRRDRRGDRDPEGVHRAA